MIWVWSMHITLHQIFHPELLQHRLLKETHYNYYLLPTKFKKWKPLCLVDWEKTEGSGSYKWRWPVLGNNDRQITDLWGQSDTFTFVFCTKGCVFRTTYCAWDGMNLTQKIMLEMLVIVHRIYWFSRIDQNQIKVYDWKTMSEFSALGHTAAPLIYEVISAE